MALVIEDGTVVAGANSYIDVPAAKAYAEARGVDLGADDAVTEQRLLMAMDYLESLDYKGARTDPDNQALAWPRTGVVVDGVTIGANTIPQRLKHAQAQLVIELFNGVVIFSSTSSSPGGSTGTKFVKREKVDVLEQEFATPEELGESFFVGVAVMPAVAALLRGLLRSVFPLYAYRG